MSSRCPALTKRGRPCPIDPGPGGWCHIHDPGGKFQQQRRSHARRDPLPVTRNLLRAAAAGWLATLDEVEIQMFADGSMGTAANRFLWLAEESFNAELKPILLAMAEEKRRREEGVIPPDLPKREWGVYVLYDAADTPFYVGMSGTPRSRLRSHVREFGEHIHKILWTAVTSRREALDLETATIHQLNPRMNIMKVAR